MTKAASKTGVNKKCEKPVKKLISCHKVTQSIYGQLNTVEFKSYNKQNEFKA